MREAPRPGGTGGPSSGSVYHFPKRQFNSKISGGDTEGSAPVSTDPHFWELGLLYDFDPTFC